VAWRRPSQTPRLSRAILDSEVRERFVSPIFDGTFGGRYLPDQAAWRHPRDARPDHATGWGGGRGG